MIVPLIYIHYASNDLTQKDHYRAKLERDILPAIGSMRMRDVRASHWQELLNSYSGGKAETVKKIKIALKQLFEDAEIEMRFTPGGYLKYKALLLSPAMYSALKNA